MQALRHYLSRGLEGLAFAMAVAAALCMVGIVAIITTAVVMRRFAGTPLHITEDVVGLMLTAVLFLGLPLVTLRSQHVRVSIVANSLAPRFPLLLHLAAMGVGVAFFGWIFVETLPWLEFAFLRNLKTETARLLLYPWMAVVPLSIGLTGLIFAARFLGLLDRENHASLESLPDITAEREGR